MQFNHLTKVIIKIVTVAIENKELKNAHFQSAQYSNYRGFAALGNSRIIIPIVYDW